MAQDSKIQLDYDSAESFPTNNSPKLNRRLGLSATNTSNKRHTSTSSSSIATRGKQCRCFLFNSKNQGGTCSQTTEANSGVCSNCTRKREFCKPRDHILIIGKRGKGRNLQKIQRIACKVYDYQDYRIAVFETRALASRVCNRSEYSLLGSQDEILKFYYDRGNKRMTLEQVSMSDKALCEWVKSQCHLYKSKTCTYNLCKMHCNEHTSPPSNVTPCAYHKYQHRHKVSFSTTPLPSNSARLDAPIVTGDPVQHVAQPVERPPSQLQKFVVQPASSFYNSASLFSSPDVCSSPDVSHIPQTVMMKHDVDECDITKIGSQHDEMGRFHLSNVVDSECDDRSSSSLLSSDLSQNNSMFSSEIHLTDEMADDDMFGEMFARIQEPPDTEMADARDINTIRQMSQLPSITSCFDDIFDTPQTDDPLFMSSLDENQSPGPFEEQILHFESFADDTSSCSSAVNLMARNDHHYHQQTPLLRRDNDRHLGIATSGNGNDDTEPENLKKLKAADVAALDICIKTLNSSNVNTSSTNADVQAYLTNRESILKLLEAARSIASPTL